MTSIADISLTSLTYTIYPQVTLTPADARKIVEERSEERHRNIRWRKVDGYARLMLRGKWKANGHSVSFSQDGTISNGNHTLRAVVRAGDPAFQRDTLNGQEVKNFSARLDIAVGLEPAARETHDRNILRKLQDDLRMMGVENATTVGGITRRAWYAEHPDGAWVLTGSGARQQLSPEDGELMEYFETHREELAAHASWAKTWYKNARLTPSIAGFTRMVLMQLDSGLGEQFMDLLASDGLELPPALRAVRVRLRNLEDRDHRRGTSTKSQEYRMALVFRAWNHFLAGTSPSSINQPLPLTNRNIQLPRRPQG
jgi:hypothetical protein